MYGQTDKQTNKQTDRQTDRQTTDRLTDRQTDKLIRVGLGNARLPPLQTDISCFCKMKYLLEKETHYKNEDNTLKEQNEIFLTMYGLPK
jgi:hypothetical protein